MSEHAAGRLTQKNLHYSPSTLVYAEKGPEVSVRIGVGLSCLHMSVQPSST